MPYENPALIKLLFNLGKLKMRDAAYYANRGYEIICSHGEVEEVILPSDASLRLSVKAAV